MSLSAWAIGRHHRAYGGGDDAARLAIALSAARSVIRVVDRTVPPMAVEWSGASRSGTDFQGHRVELNPDPVLKKDPDALDLVSAFGLHEASHSQESRSRYKFLLRREDITDPETIRRVSENEKTVFNKATGKPTRLVPAFEPMRVAAWLWNVVEDVRIERVTSAEWPGSARYFVRLVDWIWTNRPEGEIPFKDRRYGGTLEDKLALVFATCRFADRVAYPSGSVEEEERAWWSEWQREYLDEVTDTPTTIARALDHLREDEQTAQKLDSMAAEEQAEREAGEKAMRQLERMIREGVKGAPAACAPDEVVKVRLPRELAEDVRRLVNEQLKEHVPFVPAAGAANPPVRVRRPSEDYQSKAGYVGTPDSEVQAMRNALVFRASAPEYVERLLRTGNVDDDELVRWAAGDERIFNQKQIDAKPDVLMGLLVDLSGSMHGSKLETAQRIAQVVVWALHDAEGVETRVWGHTADVDGSEAEVYRIWEPGDPLSRLGLISSLPHSNNADGHAIAYCAKQMFDAEQPEKVLLVLSDGLPHANGYGGDPAMSHIRSVCHWAQQRGVRVIQVAIDPHDLRPEEQAKMFPEWIAYDGGSLPRKIAAVMARFS